MGITAKESGTYNVAPRVGAWIETWNFRFKRLLQAGSHPVWVRGLKLDMASLVTIPDESHPVWVRGLKQIIRWVMVGRQLSHPVWVRGLKHFDRSGSRGLEPSHPVWVRGLKHL